MKNKMKGGLEGVIALVIITGLIVAIIGMVVLPMSQEGDALVGATTESLADQQVLIGPQYIEK